jgi:hypothetical protein
MKQFTVTKLDRRHKAFNQFTHYIAPVWSSQLADKIRFFEWRKWCWETWGPALERDVAMDIGSNHYLVGRWAWHTEDGHRRLYFATEKELNWFVLKWGDGGTT